MLAREAVIDSLLAKDRGCSAREASLLCLGRGADELGARKREANFSFTFQREAKAGQLTIPERGAAAICFAKMAPRAEGRPHAMLHALAPRRFGKVALLQASKHEHRPFTWHYNCRSGSPADSSLVSSAHDDEKLRAAESLVASFRGHVREIASGQGAQEWLLMRRFRLTSSVSGKARARWLQDAHDEVMGVGEVLSGVAPIGSVGIEKARSRIGCRGGSRQAQADDGGEGGAQQLGEEKRRIFARLMKCKSPLLQQHRLAQGVESKQRCAVCEAR